MYTTINNLEKFKEIEVNGEKETIYIVKNHNEGCTLYAIILEEMCDFNGTVNCSIYASLEHAEEDAMEFLGYRKQAL